MSLRARILALGVRLVIKSRMRGRFEVARMRRTLDRFALALPEGVRATPAHCNGIPGERVIAAPAPFQAKRIFYIHGGGFVACSPRTHRAITGALAARGFDVFVVDYRLAPEHPFPAAIDDLVAAWRAFGEYGPACVIGDSAGANLALALMQRALGEGLAMPKAAVLLSPPVDFLGTGASLEGNKRRDPMFRMEGLRQIATLYLDGADPAQPLVSPLYADLSGLPPLLIHVGETEMLLDDSRRLAAKVAGEGGRVELRAFPHVPHVWQWADRYLPEARESLDGVAAFLRRHG